VPEAQPTTPLATAAVAPTGRQCGRCRQWFDADPQDDGVAQAGWWVCDACRVVLLDDPRGPRSRAARGS
jgi:hypothetical protein